MKNIVTKIIPIIAGIVIAAGSYFAYNTGLDEAIAIAFDKDKAVAACERLLTEAVSDEVDAE